ncbi:enolase C-terminal domain-like protein [Aspergillus alliaceus]|uniref:Enolase C-terminal domain-like protein n=1 Tax=Petromyces alliaceus TaxID=209559 RepID=A0A5N7CFA7_PETAA|nr:enolase C-terminal domain-like protein [Aspergillus alliaceus]
MPSYYTGSDATIVCITTQNGIEGWGESTPFGSTYIASHASGVRASIATIAPSPIGLGPRRVDRVNDAMDAALVGHEDAKAALDVACWDIFGKSVGLPVCGLLGGRTDVKLSIISSIYVGEPAGMRQRVAEYRAKGYKGHSIKIGGEPVADAAAFADKRPDEFFIVDANGGLSVETALRMLRLLLEGLDFVLEAPLSYMAGMCIGLKISKAGGLTRGRRQRDICLAAGYTVSVQGTSGSDIAFAAIVHLGQTVPQRSLRYILESRDMVAVKTADGAFEVHNVYVFAPSTPGLGVVPHLDVLGEPVASFF